MQCGSLMDKIHIEGLEVLALIGVYDWEREHQQRLIVDVELRADLSMAAQTDDVNNTLNYAEIAQGISDFAAKSDFKLIEALASHMVDWLLQSFPKLKIVRLKLSKPDILANAKNVAVEFTKEQTF
jgi:dihydroneopterin aldolase